MPAQMTPVSPYALEGIYRELGPIGLATFITDGLRLRREDKNQQAGIAAEQISIKALGLITGAIDNYEPEASLRSSLARSLNTEKHDPSDTLRREHAAWQNRRQNGGAAHYLEAATGIGTNLFPILTGQLIGSMIIDAYEMNEGWIGDELVTVMPNQRRRNQQLAGLTALGGPNVVTENNPYEETSFEEKYVTTSESKKGRIISLTEEVILFDMTGEIARRARAIGESIRQDRERTIVRAVIDADSGAGVYVYRPSGVGEVLYNADGSNKNYVGAGNTTDSGFNAAIPLVDWTDPQIVRTYRATVIKDDRVDGDQQPIGGLNSNLIMLVSEALIGTALSIVNATEISSGGDTTAAHVISRFANPVRSLVNRVLSSPFIDAAGGQHVNDYYIGNFKKQFVWTEIWPVQTFVQGESSEAAFERDVVLRVKGRYYGGISAVEPIWVTKVDGAA